MHPPPTNAISPAAVTTSSLKPWTGPKTTAPASPRSEAIRSVGASTLSGTPSRTRSTGSGTSANDATHGWPKTDVRVGWTRCARSTPGLRSASVVRRRPKDSLRSLAPTTATERADIIALTRPAELVTAHHSWSVLTDCSVYGRASVQHKHVTRVGNGGAREAVWRHASRTPSPTYAVTRCSPPHRR